MTLANTPFFLAGAGPFPPECFDAVVRGVAVMFLMPLCAYLAGSIPFGLLLGRMKGVDIRKVGSGNVGATNVGRVLGKKWGYICFFLDMAKGFLPVLAAGMILRDGGSWTVQNPPDRLAQIEWLGVGCAAIVGHVFNIWLGFKGGKGVATALGVVLGFFPYFTYAGLVAFAIWIIVTLATRYVSLGSITAAIVFVPLFILFNLPLNHVFAVGRFGIFAAAMACLIIIKHRGNIKRLLKGTENKIGKKKD